VIKVYDDVQYHPIPTLILGLFDGVHIAHKKIITRAREIGRPCAVVTFTKSPLEYLQNNPVSYITSKQDRINVLERAGVDFVYMLDFEKIMNLSAREYLRDVLIKYFQPKNIITGFNHTFGKNRSGDSEFLSSNQSVYKYKYTRVEPIELDGRLVSSSNIRYLISLARIEEANKLLGRRFSIGGEVIKGNQLGRKIGFPTANVKWGEHIVSPPYGVYKGSVILEGEEYPSVINWGTRKGIAPVPEAMLEAHILNFDRDIYGKNIEICLEKMLRTEMSFDGIYELKEQIKKDIASI